MKKIKAVLSIILYYIYLPFVYIIIRFDKEDPRDKQIREEMIRAREEDEARVREEMAIQISHLPQDLQQSLPLQDLLKFFLATHAIELLIKRFTRHRQIAEGLVYLHENGDIFFEALIYEEKQHAPIPAPTTIREIQRFTEIFDERLTQNLIRWINEASVHWRDIIPGFEAEIRLFNGQYIVHLKPRSS